MRARVTFQFKPSQQELKKCIKVLFVISIELLLKNFKFFNKYSFDRIYATKMKKIWVMIENSEKLKILNPNSKCGVCLIYDPVAKEIRETDQHIRPSVFTTNSSDIISLTQNYFKCTLCCCCCS